MKITKDLVFFITGGASGLGEATARYIHSLGATVAVVDMNEERLELLRKDLKERILCMRCDVTNEEEVRKAIEETVKTFGSLHAALACAGVAPASMTLTSKGALDTKLF